MEFKKFLPHESLRKYIGHYWSMTGDLQHTHLRSRDIPNGNIDVIINFGSPFRKIEAAPNTTEYAQGAIKGQFDHAVIIEQSGQVDIIGVSFHPWGFYPFVRLPMYEISNIASPLELVIDSELAHKLYEAKSTSCWRHVLDQGMLAKVDPHEKIDPILHQVMMDFSNNSKLRIEAVCESYSLSIKSLQRLFKQKVGLSPKQFNRIIRIRRLISEIQFTKKPNWMKLVVDYGFYDRSHLCHEFLTVVGVSPMAYFRNCDAFSNNYDSPN